jgi:hypothetical protein
VTDKIVIRVDVEPEDLEVHGNVCAIDPETDKKQEQWVLDQLNRGNLYAWCWCKVTARCGSFVGEDALGGISYESKEAFEKDLLVEMKQNAIEALRQDMIAAHRVVLDALKRERQAKRLLRRFTNIPVEGE